MVSEDYHNKLKTSSQRTSNDKINKQQRIRNEFHRNVYHAVCTLCVSYCFHNSEFHVTTAGNELSHKVTKNCMLPASGCCYHPSLSSFLSEVSWLALLVEGKRPLCCSFSDRWSLKETAPNSFFYPITLFKIQAIMVT